MFKTIYKLLFAPSIITSAEIEKLIRVDTERGWINFQDNLYRTTSLWRWRLFLKGFKWVSKIPYVKEYFDCDDFSSLLRVVLKFTGLTAVGEVTGEWIGVGPHAWSVIVARGGVIWLEPQRMAEIPIADYNVSIIRI